MEIAHNENGDYMGFIGGKWKPIEFATNEKGEEYFNDGGGWKPFVEDSSDGNLSPEQMNKDRSLAGHVAHTASKTGRDILEGVGSVGQLLGVPVNEFSKWLFNTDLGADKNVGTIIADAIGLDKPENDLERLVSAGVQGGASALPTMGLGAGMSGTSKLSKLTKDFLTSAPMQQIAGGAIGGGASEFVRQNGGGEWEQAGAGLLGGVVPGLANISARTAKSAIGVGSDILERLTPNGRRQIAGRELVGNGASIDEISFAQERERNLRKALGIDTPAEAEDTLAQLLQKPSLSASENVLESTSGKFGPQIRARRDAQGDWLRERATTHQEAAQSASDASIADFMSKVKKGMSADEAGNIIRGELAAGDKTSRGEISKLYDIAEQYSGGPIDSSELWAKAHDILQDTAIDPNSTARRIFSYYENGDGFSSFRQLQDLRAGIVDDISAAVKSGKNNQARKLGELKDAIDATMDTAGIGPEFEAARKARYEHGQIYDRDSNAKVLRRGDNVDGYAMSADKVPGEYLRKVGGRESMESFNRGATPKSKKALTAYGQGLVADALESKGAAGVEAFRNDYADALKGDRSLSMYSKKIMDRAKAEEAKTASLQATAKKMSGEGAKNLHNLEGFSDVSGAYTPEQIAHMADVGRIAARNRAVQKQAAVGGSSTGRNMTSSASAGSIQTADGSKKLGRLSNAYEGAKSWVAAKLDQIALDPKGTSETVKDLRARAHLDPEFAKELISQLKARPEPWAKQMAKVMKGTVTSSAVQAGRGGLIDKFDE